MGAGHPRKSSSCLRSSGSNDTSQFEIQKVRVTSQFGGRTHQRLVSDLNDEYHTVRSTCLTMTPNHLV